MIFDKLCGAAERHLPELQEILERAHLFVFDGAPHRFLKERAGFHKDFDPEIFHLPFRVTAVEDSGGLVVLADSERGQIGLGRNRKFIDVQPLVQDLSQLHHVQDLNDEERECQEFLQNRYPNALIVNYGELEGCILNHQNTKFMSGYTGYRSMLVDKKEGILNEASPRHIMKSMEPAARNATVALEELSLLTRPKDFVLETSPASPQKIKKGAIPRSHQRPTYTVLDPTSIRYQMELADPIPGLGSKKAPHERRRHIRRYVPGPGKPWKEEKLKVIDACWIGESEKTIKGKRYKVRLDI